MRSSHVALDQVEITFYDQRSVASAGLLLPATLAERLGAAHPGRKLLTLVHAMVAGADCIDDVELLRCGSTGSVLGHRVMAASTVGTFLRSFTFGQRASSTRSPARSSPGRGRWALGPAMGR